MTSLVRDGEKARVFLMLSAKWALVMEGAEGPGLACRTSYYYDRMLYNFGQAMYWAGLDGPRD